jgi:hypothetical protein
MYEKRNTSSARRWKKVRKVFFFFSQARNFACSPRIHQHFPCHKTFFSQNVNRFLAKTVAPEISFQRSPFPTRDLIVECTEGLWPRARSLLDNWIAIIEAAKHEIKCHGLRG